MKLRLAQQAESADTGRGETCRGGRQQTGGEAKRAKKAPDDRVVPRMNKINWRRKAHTHKHT